MLSSPHIRQLSGFHPDQGNPVDVTLNGTQPSESHIHRVAGTTRTSPGNPMKVTLNGTQPYESHIYRVAG